MYCKPLQLQFVFWKHDFNTKKLIQFSKLMKKKKKTSMKALQQQE